MRFQGSRFDEFSRRRLIENQDTIHELTARIRELQNQIRCMNDSRDFQDAESVRSGQSHVTSRPMSFPTHPIPEGMLSRSIGMPSRNDNGPPSIWDTHGISGNVFVNPTASSSAPYPQESTPWGSNVSEHSSPHVMSESHTPALDQRCHSGPSGRTVKTANIGTACGKDFPNFEMLDAKIASALNKIIQNSQLKKKVNFGAESPDGGPVSTRKTDSFHDLRLISSDWCS